MIKSIHEANHQYKEGFYCIIICDYCHNEKKVSYGSIKNHKYNFCSIKCLNLWKSENYRGDKNHFYNKKHSQETKDKIRESRLGKHNSNGFKKGNIPWNKDKKGVQIYSLKTREKHRLNIYKRNLFGENNPNWKGGRTYKRAGYKLIYMPEHPYRDNQNRVFEHRFVMEQHLKRYLLETEEIHHLNEIKDDNRIENLILCKNHIDHMTKFHKIKT